MFVISVNVTHHAVTLAIKELLKSVFDPISARTHMPQSNFFFNFRTIRLYPKQLRTD